MWYFILGIAFWIFGYFLNKKLKNVQDEFNKDYWNEIYANWERIRIDASKCDISVADATIIINEGTKNERSEIEKRTCLRCYYQDKVYQTTIAAETSIVQVKTNIQGYIDVYQTIDYECGEAIKRYELDMNFLEKSGEELLQENKNYEN